MSSAGPPREIWVDVLELLADVLSRSDGAELGGERFYSGLCEAVCELVHLRRAVIFRYDQASRRVHAAGSFGMDIEQFSDRYVTVESAPIAAEALRTDAVVEVSGVLRGEVAPEYAELVAEPARLFCAPMTAGGRELGVILAERALSDPPLSAAERRLLWTLGKTTALASIARIIATQRETARQLEQRIDLARDIHERVIQRLFGVSLALDGDGPLGGESRARCAEETQQALAELRTALSRPLGRTPRGTETTLAAELERLRQADPSLGLQLVEGAGVTVPAELEPLAQSVLTEAVRNAQKHASPSAVEVRLRASREAFVMEISNDGIRGGRRSPGIGLRLAGFEALQSGGMIEFGERRPGWWQVRLVVPLDG